MKKIFCTLIIFLSLVSFCFIDVFGIEQNSQVYSINDDFSENQLIVSLKPEYSQINNEINISRFVTENIITKEELSIENIIKLDREIQNDVLKFKKGCEQ